MSEPISPSCALLPTRCCAALLLAAAILPARAETFEGYVRPSGLIGIPECPAPNYWAFEACTGVLRPVVSSVELDFNPCEPVLLTGSWQTFMWPNCRRFVVSETEPTAPTCTPQPSLRVERDSPTRFHFSWDPVPCVHSFDLIAFSDSIGNPPNLDEFYCAGNDWEGTGFLVGDGGGQQSPWLRAYLVRGQQGPLATAHYGLSSSGEPRRPLSDCDVDLSEPLEARRRTVHD